MSATFAQAGLVAGRAQPITPASLPAGAEAWRTLRLRLRAHLRARWTRRVTDALDDHMRKDVGLPPRAAAPLLPSPLAAAWTR